MPINIWIACLPAPFTMTLYWLLVQKGSKENTNQLAVGLFQQRLHQRQRKREVEIWLLERLV